MYDDFKVANYSKALLSPELFGRHLSRIFTGDVVDGLTVTPGTGMKVVLAPGNAFIRFGSAAVASARYVSLVNNFDLTIGTADASNPRIDLVVLYVDNGVSLPSGTPSVANLDGKGVAKAKIVQGSPAATPAAPNATAIQASIGSGNPYTVLAQVRVDNGVSVIAANKVTDVRSAIKIGADKLDAVTFPKMKSRRVAAFNFPRNSTTIFAVDDIEYNVGGGTMSGGRYTVPVSGKYSIDASFVVLDSPVSGWIVVYVNGSAYSYQEFSPGASTPTLRASMEISLNAGDVVDIRFRNEQAARDPIIHVEPTQPRSNQFCIAFRP